MSPFDTLIQSYGDEARRGGIPAPWNILGVGKTSDLADLFLQVNGSKFSHPSDAVFVDKRLDALVAQQNDGKVILFKDGKKKTVFDLPVAGGTGNGLLDIALAPNYSKNHGVYLYYTPALRDGAAGKEAKLSLYQWNPTTAKLNFLDAVSTKKLKKQALPASEIVFDPRAVAHVVPVSQVPTLISGGSIRNSTGFSGSADFTVGAGTMIVNTDPILGSRDGGGLFRGVTWVQANSGATFQLGSGGVSGLGSYGTPIASSSSGLGTIWNANTTVSAGTIQSGVVLTMTGGTISKYSQNTGTLIPGTDGGFGTITFNGSAGITLTDFTSVGAIGSGTLNLISVNGDLDGDALLRVNNLNSNGQASLILNSSPADAVDSAFRGSFSLVDLMDDPSLPGYYVLDPAIQTSSGQLSVSQTPEPTSGAILLAGAVALLKRKRHSGTNH